jgi:hypothetical protein
MGAAMPTDVTKLGDRELGTACALLLGKERAWCADAFTCTLESHQIKYDYSTDANVARELEAEIERRALHNRYVGALLFTAHSSSVWGVITATPRQRAEAFVLAMEGQ